MPRPAPNANFAPALAELANATAAAAGGLAVVTSEPTSVLNAIPGAELRSETPSLVSSSARRPDRALDNRLRTTASVRSSSRYLFGGLTLAVEQRQHFPAFFRHDVEGVADQSISLIGQGCSLAVGSAFNSAVQLICAIGRAGCIAGTRLRTS